MYLSDISDIESAAIVFGVFFVLGAYVLARAIRETHFHYHEHEHVVRDERIDGDEWKGS